MVMQIRRTATPDLPPTALAEGQLAVEMATTPARLWVGVPTSLDPSGRKQLGIPPIIEPTDPDPGTLWFDLANKQLLAWDGTQWLPVSPRLKVSVRFFTAAATYVPPSGLDVAIVECIGGGAAGGAAYSNANYVCAGGGGGAGGYSRAVLSAADIGVSQVLSIGAGGTPIANPATPAQDGGATTFGILCSANGGSSQNTECDTVNSFGVAGDGAVVGTATNGLAWPGNSGTPATGIGNTGAGALAFLLTSGSGGVPYGGRGGKALSATSGSVGAGNAGIYGGGGGGAAAHNAGGGVWTPGGAGGFGICIVTEYSF